MIRLKPLTKIKIISFSVLHIAKVFLVITIIIVLLLLVALSKIGLDFKLSAIFNNTGLVGIIGSLFGALIGSISSFIGVRYTQRKQSESQAMILKKNTIYRPLYDEYVKVKETLLENPYPLWFEFGNGRQTMTPHPQLSAWGRIKTDSRRMQVPKYLDGLLERYNETVNQYLNFRNKSDNDIQDVINSILKEKYQTLCTITNIGQCVSHSVYDGKPGQIMGIYAEINSLNPSVKLTKSELDTLDSLIYERCNNLDSVKRTRETYIISLNEIDEIINCLKVTIELVNKKFEAYNHKYF